MARNTQSHPIVRQIYFYQMKDIMYDLWHDESMPKFSPALLAKDINALQGDARYLQVSDEYDLCLICDGHDAFQFGKARKTDMARVEFNGRVRPLTLPHGEKLFDCIHLVFFPSGIVGAEFNLVGPKMTSLTEYMVSRLTSCMPVVFERLVHTDIMERLSHMHEIKKIEMRVDPLRSEVLAPFGNGWIDYSHWVHDQFGVGSIDITLRAGSTAHRPLHEKAIDAVREMISASDLRNSADKFKISAVMDGSTVAIDIDLLDDKLMASVEVPRSIYRNPDRYKEFIYNKIRSEYAKLQPTIIQAVRITV